VTPLQLTAAVSAIANGGTMMKPYVVKEVQTPAGKRVYGPTVVGQVVSVNTARTLTAMLETVVEAVDSGQVRLARVPGYRIAGKSGTAEIPTREGYSAATIASFVGYAPADDPKFVVLVKIDEPKDSPGGETVAAPVFRAIADQLMVYFRVPPDPTPTVSN
jgi:cell division protein FtsI/penicillin-binding protein 2